MAGSSPASSNWVSEGEALVLKSPLSGSSSMNSSAAEAVIFIRLAPMSSDKDGFETTYRAGCTTNLHRALPAVVLLSWSNDSLSLFFGPVFFLNFHPR